MGQRVAEAYRIVDKAERQATLAEVRRGAEMQLGSSPGEDGEPRWSGQHVKDAVSAIEKQVVRSRILDGQPRIDGRDRATVRDITTRVGLLPRTHGSALFTRGETQALVAITLGNSRDAQIVDALEGERRDPFLFHYNFPPYCVGETGRNIGPRRREIGHGRLAKRGILSVMPSLDDFPYVIRVVSEITESNGSSSMASVCGSSMALMDAGVPIRAPVAGIAMGLVKEGDRFAVLSDIMGDEDHLGDMDFKVAGTERGVNALQMDIKIEGITREIMQQALTQARAGRLHILERMAETIREPRQEMSEYAPRIITIKIDPEKIRDVIGRGGATIRSITEETGAAIDVSDDGTIKIASVDALGGQEARRRIEQITADVEVGVVYEGKVQKIMDFGAFVNILPGQGRPRAHLPDFQRTGRERQRQAPRGADRSGQGARGRQAGPRAAQHEGRGRRLLSPRTSSKKAGIRSSSQYRGRPGTAPATKPACPPCEDASRRTDGEVGREDRAGHEGIVFRLHDEGRDTDPGHERTAARLAVIVLRPVEAVQGGGYVLVELPERPPPGQPREVDWALVPGAEFRAYLPVHLSNEISPVDL